VRCVLSESLSVPNSYREEKPGSRSPDELQFAIRFM
jgi:hypothetical protein